MKNKISLLYRIKTCNRNKGINYSRGEININNTKELVLRHFYTVVMTISFPTKTIFTAFCYSLFFSILYKRKISDFLRQKWLLCEDSFYFPYERNYKIDYTKNLTLKDITQKVYSELMGTAIVINWTNTTVWYTLQYFIQEFNISNEELLEIKRWLSANTIKFE